MLTIRYRYSSPAVRAFAPFAIPAAVFLVVLVLSLTIGRTTVGSILDATRSIEELKKDASVLAAKKQLLSALDSEQLASDAQVVVLAVPDKEAMLPVLASIRSLAFEQNVQIAEIEASGSVESDKKDTKGATLTFQLEGQLPAVMSFLKKLQESAPLVRISKMKMAASGENISTDLDVLSFWSELPQTLPPAKASDFDPISEKEQEVLSQLKSLRQVSVDQLVPAFPEGRKNPFAP